MDKLRRTKEMDIKPFELTKTQLEIMKSDRPLHLQQLKGDLICYQSISRPISFLLEITEDEQVLAKTIIPENTEEIP